MSEPENNCTECNYAVRTQITGDNNQPIIGEFQYNCHRFPPSCTAIIQPQGLAFISAFPKVDLGMYCSLFEPIDGPGSLPAAIKRLSA